VKRFQKIALQADDFICAHTAQGPEPKKWPATVSCKCGARISSPDKQCLVRVWVHHVVVALMLERRKR
jgi:hypothetical protein